VGRPGHERLLDSHRREVLNLFVFLIAVGIIAPMTTALRAALIELRNRITEGESREISALIAANEAYHKASEVLSKVTKALGSAIDANEKAYQRYRNNHSVPVQIAYEKTSEAVMLLSREQNSAIDANEKAYGELKRIRLDLGMGY